MNRTVSFAIDVQVPAGYQANLLDFIRGRYIAPGGKRFSDINRATVGDSNSLSFKIGDPNGNPRMSVQIVTGTPVMINFSPLDDSVSQEAINRIKQDIIVTIELFEEKASVSTIYFAWREGEEIVPEGIRGKESKPLNRMLLETQIMLFVVFMILSLFLFTILSAYALGWFAPLALLAIQLVFVFYSNKLIARTADWHITEGNPSIHLLEYQLPPEQQESFRRNFSRDRLIMIKKDVYDESIAKKGFIDCDTAKQAFERQGLDCKPEYLLSKKVNVYDLVKRTASKFEFPMPEIIISNTLMPNAAASGPSPSRGVVLITTGLLVQLNDEEIMSVLGHEFGHLKGRDPLLLFGLTAVEFLVRYYVILPNFPFIFLYLPTFFIYLWGVSTLIYFIAKFFEARADLISASVIGQPQVLAEALEKIGYKRLLYERVPSFRIQEWLGADPHPPLYFRVDRLEKLDSPQNVSHPLLQSMRDVVGGLLASL